jgi:hypothetical protein
MGPRPAAFPSPGTAIGTSLVFLPQQFTNGLKASDSRIRILRANLRRHGLFGRYRYRHLVRLRHVSPECRRDDLANTRRMGLPFRMLPNWLSGAGRMSWSGCGRPLPPSSRVAKLFEVVRS